MEPQHNNNDNILQESEGTIVQERSTNKLDLDTGIKIL